LSDDDGHVLLLLLLGTMVMVVMVMLMMALMMRCVVVAERLLELLMLAANRDPVHVDRYRHDEPRRRLPALTGAGVDAPAARQQRAPAASAPAVHHAGLDALPLGAPVLEPDFHLQRCAQKLTKKHLTNCLTKRYSVTNVSTFCQLPNYMNFKTVMY